MRLSLLRCTDAAIRSGAGRVHTFLASSKPCPGIDPCHGLSSARNISRCAETRLPRTLSAQAHAQASLPRHDATASHTICLTPSVSTRGRTYFGNRTSPISSIMSSRKDMRRPDLSTCSVDLLVPPPSPIQRTLKITIHVSRADMAL
jgi:hypothetical protein